MGFGTAAQQRTKLRAVAGHATDTALVSDDLLDTCLDSARREINRQFPLFGVSYFETVAGQYAYAVTLPDEATGITEALWTGAACTEDVALSQLDEWYTQFAEMIPPDQSVTQRYGVLMADLQQRSWIDRLRGTNARVQWPSTVWLSPEPEETGRRVYYFYQVDRFATVEDVEDAFVPAYWAYAKYQIHEALAAGNGGVTEVQSDTGMRIKTKAAEHHLKISERLHRQYIDLLPPVDPFRGMV